MRLGFYGVAAAAIVMQMTAAQAETLGDALVSAYKTSNLLAQNQAVLRAADEDVAVAVASLRPVVSFIASMSDTYTSAAGWQGVQGATLNLSAQMTLFDFGKSKAKIEVSKEAVLSTEQALRGVEQRILLAAATAYVNVTLQQEMVGMQESNVRLITQDLRATQDRFDVGEVTKTDVSQAEAQLAAAKAQLVASQGQLALARESYKAAVGHYPGTLAALPRGPRLPKSLAEAQAIALKTYPDVLAAQHQSRAADLTAESAKVLVMPSIVGGLTMPITQTFSTGTTSDSLTASVQMSQTIYAGGQYSALYRKALDNQDAAKSVVQLTAVNVAQAVGNAWANLDVAAASISAGDQQIKAAQAALDGVKEEAAVGSRTTLDVLNAEQALLSAKAGRLQSVANLYNGQYQLLQTMGLMTADYLHLGVPTYDPNAYYDAVKSAPATSTRGAKLDKIMKLMGRD